MRTTTLLLILICLFSSCRVLIDPYDADPMYSRGGYREPVIRQQRYYYPQPYYGWQPYYNPYQVFPYRERVIIIQPRERFDTGKRPSREEGNYNPNFRPNRGRRDN